MLALEQLISELTFKAVRSSGKGGQHVNKVSSKVELHFNLQSSTALTIDQKELLLKALKNRLTKEGILQLQCDESRSQHQNKTLVIQRFIKIIEEGLIVRKERKATKVPKSVKEKRLLNKRKNAEKKSSRKKPNLD